MITKIIGSFGGLKKPRSGFVKRFTAALLLCAVTFGVTGCMSEPNIPDCGKGMQNVKSFRDIPGVTEKEIAAIEALKASRQSFSFGKSPSAEGFILPDGTYAGFSPMLCELLSELFGIPFELNFYDRDSLLNGIDSKEIDFTCELGIIPERQNKYHTSEPVAQRSLSILTHKDRKIETPHNLNGLRVGIFTEGRAIAQTFARAYPELTFETVPIPSLPAEADMLRRGKIDAVIGISAGMTYDYGTAADLTLVHGLLPLAYTPVALTTANDELEPVISVINKYTAAGGINILYELYRAGNGGYIRNVVYNSFSDEERAYIDSLSAGVPIVLGTDTYPVSFYNSNESEFQGISIDILREVSRLTGIEFEPVNKKDATWGEILETLRTGKAALISDLIITEERREYFIWPKTPFFSTPYAFFSKTKHPNLELYQIKQAAVGVVGWCATRQLYDQWFPNSSNVKLYDSQDDALDALENDEIELFFNLGYILYYQQNYREKPGFKANYTFPVFNSTFFGLNKNERILCSIIDKTIAYIDADKISSEWMGRLFDYSRILAEEQSRHANQRVQIVSISAAVLLLLMAAVVLLLLRNNKMKKIALAIEHDAHEINERHLAKLNLIIQTAMIGTVEIELDPNDPLSPNSSTEYSVEYRKLLGHTDDDQSPESLGESRIGLVHPDDMESSFRAFTDHLLDKTGNTPFDIEQRLKKKNGEYAWFRTVGKAIRNKDGNPIRFVNAAFDMTEIKNLISEAQRQRQEAEVASKSKGNFLANMSHEMRTPMNAIIGMTAIGKKANDIEQKNHALNKIADASSHLLGIINDVLDMAKIEADKLELVSIDFNFDRAIQKVLTVVNFRAEEKEQRLTVNIDEEIPQFLIGDEQRLVQIITNLLSNAVKFTPEKGEIHLGAFLVSKAEGECELRVEVTDSGIGISDKQKGRLFKAFEQAEAGISRKYGGTGLGLVISKRIIELMDGAIWLESTLGKGAKFIFTVKMGRSDKSSASMLSPDVNRQNESCGITDGVGDDDTAVSGEFGGRNILVAEDVEINREILLVLLEDTGLIIDCAVNGEEALKMVEAAPDKYDLIFMDVQMPFMDGYEATRRIRALPNRQHGRLPIIAMTANVFKSDIEECLAAGMDDHIGKPIDIERVVEKLREYLNRNA